MTPPLDEPLASCVLIFFNSDRYLDEAIRSVVAQAGFTEWELVLVDDGSTDDSTAIAQRWSASDPRRIRYVDHAGHANLGMSAARNVGISVARGEYVAFLDSDDIWLPSSLAHRMRLANAHPSADVVASGTWRWHSWTGNDADVVHDHRMALPSAPLLTVIEPPALFGAMYGMPGGWKLPGMCSLMIRRRSLLAIGGMQTEFRDLHEDQVLYVKMSLRLRVLLDPRPLALYRQHAGSACSVAESDGTWHPVEPSPKEARFLCWMEEFVRREVGADSSEWAVVQRNLLRHGSPEQARPKVSPIRAFARRHTPHAVRRLVQLARRAYSRRRARLSRRSVLAEWSQQHFSAFGSTTGSVLVIVPRAPLDDEWTFTTGDAVFTSAAQVTRRPLGMIDRGERFDLVLVPTAAGVESDITALLEAIGRALQPAGTATALVPGSAFPSSMLRGATQLEPAELASRAAATFPGKLRAVETFGNCTTAAAVAGRVAVSDVPGVLLDHHDAQVPVLIALTISPLP